MKITRIHELQGPAKDECGAWDRVINFRINELVDVKDSSEFFGKWCSENFCKNFILLNMGNKHVAGGYTDNKVGWRNRHKDKYHRNRFDHSYYQLRCCDKDATLFLLRFS